MIVSPEGGGLKKENGPLHFSACLGQPRRFGEASTLTNLWGDFKIQGMKRCLLFALLLILSPLLVGEVGVILKVSPLPAKLLPGHGYSLRLSCQPSSGRLVNYYPLMTITLEDSTVFRFPKREISVNDLDPKLIEREGKKYLDPSQPLKVPFFISSDSAGAETTLKVTVNGFYTEFSSRLTLKFTQVVRLKAVVSKE